MPSPAGSGTAAPAGSSADTPRAPAPSPTEQADQAAKHKAAFARARGAVKTKDYKTAIQAYTEARQLLPEDAQTLGERGYTKWLAGDTMGAEFDLDGATILEGDAKVLAQIWYNLGLAYDGRKQAELARMAYAASVSLSPSKAALEKLAGKSKCAASMTSSAHPDARVVKGWLGVWDALSKPGATPRPKTEAAAKAAVCTEKATGGPDGDEDSNHCEEAPPWKVAASVGKYDEADRTQVIPAEKDNFVMLPDGSLGGGSCAPWVAVDYELHPRLVREKFTYGTKRWVESPAPGGGDPITECIEGGLSLLDIFYDRATGKKLVAVDRTDVLKPPIEVKLLLDEGVVTVTGGGCNERLPLAPAAPR